MHTDLKYILGTITAFLFIFSINAQTLAESIPSRDLLPLQIKRIKPSVAAVGTYYFKDTPAVKFLGTAFAVDDGRLILTNAHTINVIEEEKKLDHLRIFHHVFPSRGVRAKVLVKDETHDLALLKIESGRLPPLKISSDKNIQEGEAVAFTGYPIGFVLGLNATTHVGIISAISPIVVPSSSARLIKKEIVEFLRQPFDVYQIDATAYPGNSGSPVFRISDGEVIGIVNLVFVKGKKEHMLKEPTGISYAIPAKFAHEMIESYHHNKKN